MMHLETYAPNFQVKTYCGEKYDVWPFRDLPVTQDINLCDCVECLRVALSEALAYFMSRGVETPLVMKPKGV